MTDTPGSTRGPRTTAPDAGAGRTTAAGPDRSGTGWVAFAAYMMFLVACYQLVQGLVALVDDEYYQVGSSDLVVQVGWTGWGWAHLVLSVAIGASAAGVMAGNTLARAVGVLLAVLSAVANLLFLSAAPVWGLVVIAVDVVVIWALVVHGGELRDTAG